MASLYLSKNTFEYLYSSLIDTVLMRVKRVFFFFLVIIIIVGRRGKGVGERCVCVWGGGGIWRMSFNCPC